MCGIIGYVGKKQAAPLLVEGLRKLEYRGYDSAGISVLDHHQLQTFKKKGRIQDGLAKLVEAGHPHGNSGIGHTRWATHGPPSDENSHPHLDQSGRISVVHNGVIENYTQLKARFPQDTFKSSTDTEALAHLIGFHYEKLSTKPGLTPVARLTEAVTHALKEVVGTYGLAVLCSEVPGVIIAARRGSPLILGLATEEIFLASDASALVGHTRDVVYLSDYDLAVVRADGFELSNLGTGATDYQVSRIEYSAEAAEKGGYAHYMLKEIFEQPETIENAFRGRLDLEEATSKLGGLNMTPAELRAVDEIVIAACGTSWHAGLAGEYLFEELAQIPVEVEYASEFRYRNQPLTKNTLVLVITQSGETADTLAALREAKRRGHKVLALCNVVGSTIAREADGGVYLRAGPEISVASTKAFTSQVTVLALLATLFGRMRMLPPKKGVEILHGLQVLPDQVRAVLGLADQIKAIAKKYTHCRDFYFLGRQIGFPVALEGALKLKEISYIHAEGYSAAELKHGPIALIDEESPSVAIIPNDSMHDRLLANLEMVKARKGPIIAIATAGDTAIAGVANDVIYLPQTPDLLMPILAIIPLQLLAYYIAVERGCDVDKPRNLAKSVTVS